MEEIDGYYDEDDDWGMDPKGYFLIRINKEKKLIEAGLCKEGNKCEVLVRGKKPQDIYWEFAKRELVSKLDHAAYLGKELEKAYLALKYNLEYIQDEELELNI